MAQGTRSWPLPTSNAGPMALHSSFDSTQLRHRSYRAACESSPAEIGPWRLWTDWTTTACGSKSQLGCVDLTTVNDRGYVCTKQGKLDRAEGSCLDALQITEKNFGVDHLSTFVTVSYLGDVYMQQGRPYQAQQMYERAPQGYQKNLDPERASTYIPALMKQERYGNGR